MMGFGVGTDGTLINWTNGTVIDPFSVDLFQGGIRDLFTVSGGNSMPYDPYTDQEFQNWMNSQGFGLDANGNLIDYTALGLPPDDDLWLWQNYGFDTSPYYYDFGNPNPTDPFVLYPPGGGGASTPTVPGVTPTFDTGVPKSTDSWWKSLLGSIGGVPGAISTGSNLLGSIMGANAAKNASEAQVAGTKYAADLTYKAAEDALALQLAMFMKGQQNIEPWLTAGKSGLTELQRGLGIGEDTGTGTVGYGSLMQPWDKTFQAPDINESNDPGLAFRLAEGEKMLNNSLAAKGGALSGAAVKSAMRYGQDYASNEYANVYNRAASEFDRAYNIFKQNQADQYNKLAALSGVGQVTAGELNQLGQNYANTGSNIIVGQGNTAADLAVQAANARASGYMGSSNAWQNGLNNISNNLLTAYLNSQIQKSYT